VKFDYFFGTELSVYKTSSELMIFNNGSQIISSADKLKDLPNLYD
jgi:hypothetical protein